MARGGYRPGAGRPKGTVKKQLVKTAALPFISKAEELAIFYKGMLDQVAQGKKPTEAEKQKMQKLAAELAKTYETGGENEGKPIEELLPLDFMLRLMNNTKADMEMRARMATAAAPYCHPRKSEGAGKKDEKADRAKQAGSGKFKAGAAPLKLVGKP